MEFLTKSKSGVRSKDDVSICLSKNGTGRGLLAIVFRNDCHEKIARGKEKYITIAFEGNRVYFAVADYKTGFKVSGHMTTYTRYIKISTSNALIPNDLPRYFGDFELKYDEKEGYYYVESN